MAGITAPKCVVFCDFDGTISVQDTLDVLIDDAMGEASRLKIDQQYEDGEISFRELLANEIDVYDWAVENYERQWDGDLLTC